MLARFGLDVSAHFNAQMPQLIQEIGLDEEQQEELKNINVDDDVSIDYCNGRYAEGKFTLRVLSCPANFNIGGKRACDIFQAAMIKLSSQDESVRLHGLSSEQPFNTADVQIPLCYKEYQLATGYRVCRIFTSGPRLGEFTGAVGQAYKPEGLGDIVWHPKDIALERVAELDFAKKEIGGEGEVALKEKWKRQDWMMKSLVAKQKEELFKIVDEIKETQWARDEKELLDSTWHQEVLEESHMVV